MRRRSFMQSAAVASLAALFRPTVLLRQAVSREALLQAFCLTDYETIYGLETPFNVGSLTYATNGRQMARCELLNTLDDGAARRRPGVEAVYDNLWRPDKELRWVERPQLEDLVEDDCFACPKCLGRRIPVDINDDELISKYWDDWDGDDSTLSDHTCDWHWDPIKDRRRDEFPSVVKLDGCYFGYENMLKIWAIPNVRMSARRFDEENAYLYFTGDGFQGICSGVKRGRHARA